MKLPDGTKGYAGTILAGIGGLLFAFKVIDESVFNIWISLCLTLFGVGIVHGIKKVNAIKKVQ